jgi:hypothetical protein
MSERGQTYAPVGVHVERVVGEMLSACGVTPPDDQRPEVAAVLVELQRLEARTPGEMLAAVKREPMWGRLVRLAPYSHKVRALVNLIAPNSMSNADAVGLLSHGNGHFPRPEPAVRLTDAERGACARIAALKREKPDTYNRGLAHWEHMAGLYREAGNEYKAAVFAGMAAETRRIAGGISDSPQRPPAKKQTRWQTVEAD